MRTWLSVGLLLALVAAPANGFAEGASPWTQQNGWTARAGGKLSHGLTNLLLGWTELITEPDEALWNGESLTGGVTRGLWHAVGQTLGGAVQVLTFPYTAFDVPLPEGGVGWHRSTTPR